MAATTYKFWIILHTGSYGYMFAEKSPKFGDWVTIRVLQPDGSTVKESGIVQRVE